MIRHSDYEDVSAIFDQLDNEITILLSSATENDSIQLLTPISLKSGQHLIGLAPQGKYVELEAPKSFVGYHMVEVGSKELAKNEPLRETSVIRGIHFAPAWDGTRNSVDSIILAQCYNGELVIKDNRFSLDRRAAVYLGCNQSNKEVPAPKSALANTEMGNSSLRGGPGLIFDNNRVYGLNSKHVDAWLHPNEGVFIKTPLVTDLPKKYQPLIQNNQFIGVMKEAVELNSGSAASILNNTVKASSTGALAEGGFYLTGTSSENPPLYTISDNALNTEFWGINIDKNIRLSMSKNQITSNVLFKQNERNSLITVSEVGVGNNCETCNTWTSGPKSEHIDACKDLLNMQGNIHFKNATCSTVITQKDNSGSRMTNMAFGLILTTLVMYYNL